MLGRGSNYLGRGSNFTGLVLGCIEAKFCKSTFVGISYLFEKKIVGKLSPRSTQCTPLHRFGIHNRKLGKKEPGQNNPEKGKMRGFSHFNLLSKICEF